MTTQAEEQQAAEFLKRAEVRTMKKDLEFLREADVLKERDKIIKLKTLEEQLEEKRRSEESAATQATTQKARLSQLGEVLERREKEEGVAEKDLKQYANEKERQQIFLLESQRFGFEKQIDAIDAEKDPALKLEKNELLIQKRGQQEKLDSILKQEQKFESEEKFIAENEQATTIPSQKKSLEQSRWDLDKKIQDIEKKRWEAERSIQDTDKKIAEVDKLLDLLIIEKDGLRDKVLGVDRLLREIFSVIMAREEEKRRGQAQEQTAGREAFAKAAAEQKEKVQREQWTKPKTTKSTDQIYLKGAPKAVREKLMESVRTEEEQRKKFLEDVERLSAGKEEQVTQELPKVPTPQTLKPK